MQQTMGRRSFVKTLGILMLPLTALAQDKNEKREEKKKEAEDKREKAKDKGEEAKDKGEKIKD